MRTASDVQQDSRDRLWAARDPGLLVLGAILLFLSPALPGLTRIVVLPALLLAPGFAFLRVLGQRPDWRSVSVAVPASIVVIICAVLLLDVSNVRLEPVSLGFTLGSFTALCVAVPYARQLTAGAGRGGRGGPPRFPDREMVRRDATREVPRDPWPDSRHDTRPVPRPDLRRDPRPPAPQGLQGPQAPPWPDPRRDPRPGRDPRPPAPPWPEPQRGPRQSSQPPREEPRPDPRRNVPFDERWYGSR